jgi:putative transposase
MPDCAHHVTQRGVRAMSIFRDDEDRHLYLRLLGEQGKANRLRFLAWCLMTNHAHLVGVPPTRASLARAIGEAHRRYTWRVNRRDGVTGWLFQGRFNSCALDERHGIAAIRYVERNPVRAGLAEQAWEYPWSSAAFHVGGKSEDPLVIGADLLGSPGQWRKWLACDPAEIEAVRRAARTGRPCGSAAFVSRLERRTSRRRVPRSGGRPRKHRAGARTGVK